MARSHHRYDNAPQTDLSALRRFLYWPSNPVEVVPTDLIEGGKNCVTMCLTDRELAALEVWIQAALQAYQDYYWLPVAELKSIWIKLNEE